MSEGPPSLEDVKKSNRTYAKSRWPVALSFLINLPLLFIFAGPWIWAYFSSDHVDAPGHYVEDTFRSIRTREAASWHSIRGDDVADNEVSKHQNVHDALDRVEVALKKPVLDRVEIQHALDDLTKARKEVQQSMSHLLKHDATLRSASGPDTQMQNAKATP